MKKVSLILGLALLATVAVAKPARAVLLSDLIANASTISAGNLVFSDFGYLNTGDMPLDTGVNIVPYFDGADWGIKIQGGFLDLPGGGASDASLTFNVAVAGPGFAITQAALAGNPAVLAGAGSISVDETFVPENAVDQLSIFANSPGSTQLADSASFATSYESLSVQKSISAFSPDDGGVATLSFITQTYHVVPEPTSLALAGMGAMAFALRMARRRSCR